MPFLYSVVWKIFEGPYICYIDHYASCKKGGNSGQACCNADFSKSVNLLT